MSVMIDGFDKECTKCQNASVFIEDIYVRKWFIFNKYSHTEHRCFVCNNVEDNRISVKRNDILKKLGI